MFVFLLAPFIYIAFAAQMSHILPEPDYKAISAQHAAAPASAASSPEQQ